MKFFGKELTRARLKWWLIITVTNLFGRRLEVEGSPKRRKVLPFIWKGKLHLFGMQHFCAKVVFDGKYSTRVIESPRIKPILREGRNIPEVSTKCSFAHVLLMHFDKATTERMLKLWHELAGPGHQIILAYGGTREEYEKIEWPNRFFVPQQELWPVKPGLCPSHTYALKEAAKICLSHGHDGLLYSDSDAWPASRDYLDSMCRPAWTKGIDFYAPRIRDITHSSYHFDPSTGIKIVPSIQRWVRKHDLEDPNAAVRILTALGAVKYYSSAILGRFVDKCSEEPPLSDEMAIPTYMHYLGASYCSLEDLDIMESDHFLRYRPALSRTEIEEAISRHVPIIHPVKDNDLLHEHSQKVISANTASQSGTKQMPSTGSTPS